MNRSSRDYLRDTMNRYGELLDRDHDRLREELLASLPDSLGEPTTWRTRLRKRFLGGGNHTVRRLMKLAAMLVIATGIGLLVWLQPQTASAEVAFAEVLRQIREAFSVRYKSTLELGNEPPRTSEIVAKTLGLERKTMPEGQQQISDYNQGIIIYVDPQEKWTLTIELEASRRETSFLKRLANLSNDAGRFLREETLDGKPVSVFEVSDKDDRITIWADSDTGLPVKICVVSQPTGGNNLRDEIRAVLTLSDFVWNEPVDDAIFRPVIRDDYEQYRIKLIDDTRPSTEEDFVEALRILSDLSEGAFPDSLYTKDLQPIVNTIRQPDAAVIGTGTGLNLLAGYSEPVRAGEPPSMVQYYQAIRDRKQISRGIQFVNQMVTGKKRWYYQGKGVRRGQRNPVFQYQPDSSRNIVRVILGDLSVHEYTPQSKPKSKPRQD